MKTTNLIVIILLIFRTSVTGQTDKYKYSFKNLNIDTAILKSIPDFQKSDNISDLKSKPKLKIRQNRNDFPEMNRNRSSQNYLFNNEPFVIAEEGPGTLRFYSNMPNINPDTRGKIMVKRPDPSVKYYLLIKDVSIIRINKYQPQERYR
jgi:hypothetical protein